jgi:hypothetical protein
MRILAKDTLFKASAVSAEDVTNFKLRHLSHDLIDVYLGGAKEKLNLFFVVYVLRIAETYNEIFKDSSAFFFSF